MSLSVWQRWTAGTVCALAMATAAYAQTTPYATINNPSGPVKNLFVGNDLSVQIDHQLDTSAFQIYPASTRPADYGTLIAVDNTLYTPDFSKHGGTATGGLGARTPFTAVSQTPPAGSGTVADPYRVTTVVDVGTSGLRISQNDSYVSGQDTYRTDITLQNTGAADKTLVLYRAMDCYLGASDSGYGAATAGGTISCTKNANNTPPGRVMSLIPLTAGSSYRQDGFSAIWSYISTKQPFDDNCVQCANSVDNGMGLSWSLTIPAGGTATVSHLTLFSPTGAQPLTTAKTANPGSVTAGQTVSYTITVSNPNAATVSLDTLVDTLPTGFSYVAGTSRLNGSAVADPAIAGQVLTWNTASWGGINGGGNTSLTFTARTAASLAAGTYYNRVQGTATGYTVQDSGNTAPVVVTAGTPTPPPPPLAALTTSKTVSTSSALPGTAVSYTITVNNPNSTAVNLDTLVDTLPTGLSYVAGSTTGATTADPAVAGQVLTWNGPLTVAANGALNLTFGALIDANATPGLVYNNVSGTAAGHTVQPSGSTAALMVLAPAPAPTTAESIPTLSFWGMLLTALLLAFVVLRQRKVAQRR